MEPSRVSVSVRDMPEVLYEVRKELANILRRHASQHANHVFAKELRALAAVFETGAASNVPSRQKRAW